MPKPNLEINDFLHYRSLSDLQYARGGQHAAFVSALCNPEGSGYQKTLYLYTKNTNEITALAELSASSFFTWEGKEHLLLGERRAACQEPEAGTSCTTFTRLSVSTGEQTELFSLPLAVERVVCLPGGKYAIVAKVDLTTAGSASHSKEEKLPGFSEAAIHRDYEVFEELPLRQNSGGYVSCMRRCLYVVSAQGNEIEAITTRLFDTENFRLSPDGKSLIYSGREFANVKMLHYSICRYDTLTGCTTPVLKHEEKMFLGFMDCDDEGVIYTATDMQNHGFGQNKHIYRFDFASGVTRRLAEYDRNIGSSDVVSDCRIGSVSQFSLYEGEIYFGTTERFHNILRKCGGDGKMQEVLSLRGSVEAFDIAAGTILFIAFNGLRLQELYRCNTNGTGLEQLSHFNEHIHSEKTLVQPEHFTYGNRDGVELDGFILRPVSWKAGQKYPAILNIHGGPRLVYGEIFYHEMQYWANHGYFVLFTNPRGGSGRGDDFTDLWSTKKFGKWDYEDLMDFTDEALRRCPEVDAARVGVTGGSYGGFMTNWIIGQTGRFAAAASQRSISNWFSNTLTSDNGYFDWNRLTDTDIWAGTQELWDVSPIKYANQATTPTLFIHSFEDYRCPFEQGLQMFTALKMNRVETRMCVFYNENHDLSRTGKPANRAKRLAELSRWFDIHLKGRAE